MFVTRPVFHRGPNINFSSRKLEDAKKRIEKTIVWRREFKPDLIPPEEVSSWNNSHVSLAE